MFHTSLNVADLPQAIAFYRLLLNCEPAKQRPDYAKFELSEPPLVLSLIPGRPSPGGALNHFGLRVPHAEVLVETQRRLELGGIRTQREEGVACCYALQTKFWVADPDRTLWEIYVLEDDLDERGDGSVPEATALPQPPAPSRTVWRHQLGTPLPTRLPLEPFSVHELVLEGTANSAAFPEHGPAFLAECFRVLRPGGVLRLHGLTADHPLTTPPPPLPGPAAAVEWVPTHRQVEQAVTGAGFTHLHLETLSATAHFTAGTVALRELRLTAHKPGHRSAAQPHTATYLGPLASVADDFGRTFSRGVPVPLNVHDFQALRASPAAGSFLLQ